MTIRPNDRNWFVRLYNFNPNWEYYISPGHGIKSNLVSSCQTLTFEERSIPVETRKRKIFRKNGLIKFRQLKVQMSFFWFLKTAKAPRRYLNGL